MEDDIFDYFRSLMQHRSALVFIFVGAHRLEEMTHDYWSIFFNIAIHQKISYLKEDEARQLITEPVAGSLEYEDYAVNKIIRVTHCHPYFVQLICWALVNHCNACQRNYATINDVNTVLDDILVAGEAHFAYVWQQSSPWERLVLAVLAKMLRPGKDYALLSEMEQALEVGGAILDKQEVVQHLNELCMRDVLGKEANGGLRYRFQIELVRLWIDQHKSIEEAIAGVTTT
ncbi:MAG: hypothetical protein E3J82_00835 [Candidatus Thorarchaeota archaeon]|nr:MAG: hypothetical protein E3J82_00835 [Candidatus Thorarchaeota archaeon]